MAGALMEAAMNDIEFKRDVAREGRHDHPTREPEDLRQRDEHHERAHLAVAQDQRHRRAQVRVRTLDGSPRT